MVGQGIVILWVILLPFSVLGQQERRHILFTEPIIPYHSEKAGQGNTDWCRIDLRDFTNEYQGKDCSNAACDPRKRHMAGHCSCPPTGRRLVNGKHYTLLNPCEPILLYKSVVNPGKWTSIEYYFSKDPDTEIMPLTRENLKKAFPDNKEFHKKLDALFLNNSQLARFDKLYNIYVVNWLYTHVNSWNNSEAKLVQ